jgi:DnaJ-class molecular chaperone
MIRCGLLALRREGRPGERSEDEEDLTLDNPKVGDHALQKRHLPVTVLVVVAIAISVAGYMRTPSAEEMPRRLLFDSTGGSVIFSHLEHERTYNIDCATCHHESENPGNAPVPCGRCHPSEFTPEYVADHQALFEDPDHCERCHHTGVADGPCSSCHGETIEQLIPTRMNAFHRGCMGCHEGMQAGPYSEDSCNQCHMPR